MTHRFVRFAIRTAVLAVVMLAIPPIPARAADAPPTTPAELTATYSSLADVILGAKRSEANLVRSILGTTYAQAQGRLAAAKGALKAGDAAAARSAVEALAALVGQLATEGDASVAAIRKRLLEGGHHHNAAGEAKGIFEEGYVIVTRAGKTSLLDSSKAIGQMSLTPGAEALGK